MVMIVIQHPVADFEAWKRTFESDPLGRAKNGVVRHSVFRPVDDPNFVFVSLEFPTREAATRFLSALRELWKGVGDKIGFGDASNIAVRIFDEVERVDY